MKYHNNHICITSLLSTMTNTTSTPTEVMGNVIYMLGLYINILKRLLNSHHWCWYWYLCDE